MSAPLAPGWAPSPVQGEFYPPSSPTLGQDILGLSHPCLCWLLSVWCPTLCSLLGLREGRTRPFHLQDSSPCARVPLTLVKEKGWSSV